MSVLPDVGRVCILFLTLAATVMAAEPAGTLRPASAPAVATNPAASAPLIELDGSISISPDGSELSYRWRQISGPPVDLSDPASAKPRFRTTIPGIYEFELVVSSNGLDSEPHLVRLEIERENLPPVAKLLAEAWGQVGKAMEVDGSASLDPEGESLTYQWRLLSPGLTIPAAALTERVLVFEPDADGSFELELVVSDGEKTSEPARTLLRIKPKPLPPVARVKIVTVNAAEEPPPPPAGDLVAMAPPATRPEPTVLPMPKPPAAIPAPPAVPIPPTLQPLPELPSAAPGASPPALLPVPAPPPAAPVPARQPSTVDDWVPAPDPTPVAAPAPALAMLPAPEPAAPAAAPVDIIGWEPSAVPPVARITAPAQAEAGSTVMLDARDSYSPSGHRPGYAWRQVAGPPVAEMEAVLDGAARRFVPVTPGRYEFELTVTDQGVTSDPVSRAIDVIPPAAPPVAVVVAPTHATPGSIVRMDARKSYDPAGLGLTYRWRQTGGPAVRDYIIDENSGDAAPAFKPAVPGLYSFSLTVFNGTTASNQVDLDIEVTEAARRPPELAIGGPERARIGERLVYSAMATNAAGWVLNYSWDQLEGPGPALSPSGGIRAMAVPAAAGRYVFKVTAKDEEGREVASAQKSVDIHPGRSARIGATPFVTPPTPVQDGAEAVARRVPEIAPLPGTAAAPMSFPRPAARDGRASAEVLRGNR